MAIRSLKSGTFSRSGLVGNPVIMPGSYESIATVTVSSATSSIVFSSIPSTYTHLQIRGITRSSSANNYDNIWMRFNSDTGSNYASHYLAGNGAAADAYAWSSETQIRSFYTTGGAASSNVFSVSVLDILDYANTSKNKTTRHSNGFDNNATGTGDYAKGTVVLSSGLWRSTSAVSAIEFTINGGANFTQYSSFALYGVN
jgi:hypothetical protein